MAVKEIIDKLRLVIGTRKGEATYVRDRSDGEMRTSMAAMESDVVMGAGIDTQPLFFRDMKALKAVLATPSGGVLGDLRWEAGDITSSGIYIDLHRGSEAVEGASVIALGEY